MGNLFLESMDVADVQKINNIKKHKSFLSRVINDLGNVYTIFVSNQDDAKFSRFSIKKSPNYNPTFFFKANEDGVIFSGKILGYKVSDRPNRSLGWIIEKYDTCTAEKRFIEDDNCHGFVEVNIHFTESSPNLNDIIRDIVRIFDFEGVPKKF